MITISPGHYGPKTGASNIIDEGTEAVKVAKRITAILRAAGITTNYIEDNVSKSQSANLVWLITQHNKTSRKLDVSVHFNSSGGQQTQAIGTEVLYYSDGTLATKISKAISEAGGLPNRGAKKRTELGFLKGTTKPCVLLEICFVNSIVDVALYRKNFEAICQAIAKELATAVGKSIKSSDTVNIGQGELRFSSVTLKNEVNTLLTDKAAQKELINKAITAGIINEIWLKKFTENELEVHDILGISVLYSFKKE